MNALGYNLLAGLAVTAATLIALLGAGHSDDLLAISLVGLAGTIAGRGKLPQ